MRTSVILDRSILVIGMIFLFGFYVGMTGGYIQTDEAWFLQVINRTIHGEVLYRDIYFGITPLSLYMASSLAVFFGTELLIIRLVMAGCYALICWLTYLSAIRLDLSRTTAMLILLGLVAYLPYDLRNGTPYTITAYLFLVAAFYSFLSWLHGLPDAKSKKSTSMRLFFAGAFAGLSFASKQSIGLYAGVALFVALMVVHIETNSTLRTVIKRYAIAVAGFLLLTLMVLMPALLTGSIQQFIEYGFLNKGVYMEVIQSTNINQFSQIVRIWVGTPLSLRVVLIYASLVFLVPFASYGAFILMVAKRKISNISIAAGVISFTVAATAGLFPNVTIAHLVNALPMLLIGLAYAIDQIGFHLSRQAERIISRGLVFWLCIGVVLLALFPLNDLVRGNTSVSNLPHFRAALLNNNQYKEIRDSSDRLRQSVHDGPVFLFMQTASLYYLAANLVNPTPFDLPLYPALGLHGESEIIAAIQSGEISYACLHPLGNQPRKPVYLESFILENMHKVRNAGPCILYQLKTE